MGMGVGLSICHGIIEDHKGYIVAENATNGGAIFTITLPVNEGHGISINYKKYIRFSEASVFARTMEYWPPARSAYGSQGMVEHSSMGRVILKSVSLEA